MAVYTDLTDEQLTDLMSNYDIGNVLSLKGIAEGVENSNFQHLSQRRLGPRQRTILNLN